MEDSVLLAICVRDGKCASMGIHQAALSMCYLLVDIAL